MQCFDESKVLSQKRSRTLSQDLESDLSMFKPLFKKQLSSSSIMTIEGLAGIIDEDMDISSVFSGQGSLCVDPTTPEAYFDESENHDKIDPNYYQGRIYPTIEMPQSPAFTNEEPFQIAQSELGKVMPSIRSLLCHDNLPVYYSYARYRHMRMVLEYTGDVPPSTVKLTLRGNSMLQVGKSQDSNNHFTYKEGHVSSTIIFTLLGTCYIPSCKDDSHSLIKLNSSKAELCDMKRIKLDIAVLLQGLSLFPRHARKPNEFHLDLSCEFETANIQVTPSKAPPPLRVHAKTHKRMEDLPVEFQAKYEDHFNKFKSL